MNKAGSAAKVKLNSFDDLFGVSDMTAVTDQVQEIPLSELYEFRGHPFKVLDDEKMQETVESIKNYGVLMPGIARPRAADTVFQLDPFHRNRAIRDFVPYKEAVEAIHAFLDEKDIEGMFEYLEIYRDSLDDDNEIEKANKLITYFKNNRMGLLSYQDQGIVLPEHPKGLVYRNMGTMENHIWSTIAKRMKHNHTSWSIRGGNHLAKILAKKCSGRLDEVSAKLKAPRFEVNEAQ